jgi:hypothetical protein
MLAGFFAACLENADSPHGKTRALARELLNDWDTRVSELHDLVTRQHGLRASQVPRRPGAREPVSLYEREIREAVLGHVGTLIAFRLGAPDAVYLSKEFEPVFDREDLMNLANHHIYLRLMIDGTPSKPFSAETLEPLEISRSSAK